MNLSQIFVLSLKAAAQIQLLTQVTDEGSSGAYECAQDLGNGVDYKSWCAEVSINHGSERYRWVQMGA